MMNNYYAEMVYGNSNYLEHHGIQGMKWGVTNGPPYPLGQNVCSLLSNRDTNNAQLLKAMKQNYKQSNGQYSKEAYRNDVRIVKNDAAYKEMGMSEKNRQTALNEERRLMSTKSSVTSKKDANMKYAVETGKVIDKYQKSDHTRADRDEMAKAQMKLDAQHNKDLNDLKASKENGKTGMSDTTKKILIAAGATAAVAAAGFVAYKVIDHKAIEFKRGQDELQNQIAKASFARNQSMDKEKQLRNAEKDFSFKSAHQYGAAEGYRQTIIRSADAAKLMERQARANEKAGLTAKAERNRRDADTFKQQVVEARTKRAEADKAGSESYAQAARAREASKKYSNDASTQHLLAQNFKFEKDIRAASKSGRLYQKWNDTKEKTKRSK